MDIKVLMTNWVESFSFFSRSNLTLFILITLNTFLRAIKILLNLFWWLYASFLITTILSSLYQSLWIMILHFFIKVILFYVLILSLRPSLERKDFAYYLQYSSGIWLVALLSSLTFFIPCAFTRALAIAPLLTFLLFFFDSTRTMPALLTVMHRTGRALVYFLPIYTVLTLTALLMLLLSSGLGSGLQMLATLTPSHFCMSTLWRSLVGVIFPHMIEDIFMLLVMACMVIYYTKNKHAHFQLLFD